ncbi:MAG TPA: thiolase family protein [Caldilineales bacterium]|nr:thiolase family protein [Caldilineales bacterium]
MNDSIYPVILAAARTPGGRLGGALSRIPAPKLGAHVIRAVVERSGIDPKEVEEVFMGQVIPAGSGQAPARQAALHGGLPHSVGAVTLNKVCGSGLRAVMFAASAIRAGDGRLYVAGGMENMSMGPYMLPKARFGYRLGNGEVLDATVHDGLIDSFNGIHMGNEAEWIARTFEITREMQDQFAYQSHMRAAQATEEGRFKDEMVPITVKQKRQEVSVDRDEPIRPDTSMAALARLKPAFEEGGTVTAGNAPPISDGAAAVVVAHPDYAQAHALTPLARIIGYTYAAVEPLQVFTAPPFAIRRLMKQIGWSLADVDLFELNEAFAAQSLQNIIELGLDPEKVNVHGGAIALGHPLGASGARVLTTLIYALRQHGGQRGVAALCLGGGEAVAMAIELI